LCSLCVLIKCHGSGIPRRPSVEVSKIARAMRGAADFQNVFMHNVVAEHAEPHALAELGTEPPSRWERDQSAAMFAQLLHQMQPRVRDCPARCRPISPRDRLRLVYLNRNCISEAKRARLARDIRLRADRGRLHRLYRKGRSTVFPPRAGVIQRLLLPVVFRAPQAASTPSRTTSLALS
jgi:hypothetical protein